MQKSFFINKHEIGVGPCYIIAEIGSNHDREKCRALRMIRALAQARVNAVKFQLFRADRIAADIDIPETRLNDRFSKFGKTLYSLYKDMELPSSWLKELKSCADECGVDFLVTPFDEQSADEAAQVGVPAVKIASFELTHIPLLKHVARFKLPVFLSTGMANLEEIGAAVNALCSDGEERIALFHCGIDYPVLFKNVHLRCMETMRREFQCPVGYSDHTLGTVVPVAAVAMGASLFEKHVTLDSGVSPDHDFALTVEEFANMIVAIRDCEKATGTFCKDVQADELSYLLRGRRSLFIRRGLKKGDIITNDHLAILRPGVGLPPSRYEEVLGKTATRDIKAMTLLAEGDWQ